MEDDYLYLFISALWLISDVSDLLQPVALLNIIQYIFWPILYIHDIYVLGCEDVEPTINSISHPVCKVQQNYGLSTMNAVIYYKLCSYVS